jgi:hypothetical protein
MNQSMICYVSIALVSACLMQLEHLNNDELPGWTCIGWVRFIGFTFLAGLTTYKAYVARPPQPDLLPPDPTGPALPPKTP